MTLTSITSTITRNKFKIVIYYVHPKNFKKKQDVYRDLKSKDDVILLQLIPESKMLFTMYMQRTKKKNGKSSAI